MLRITCLQGKNAFFARAYSTKPLATRLKFFTKPDCVLCYEANVVLQGALDDINTTMREKISEVEYIDISQPENKSWFECYRYDIPVLHVERDDYKKVVFMHKFDYDELVEELGQE
jgi:hypothetical protein